MHSKGRQSTDSSELTVVAPEPLTVLNHASQTEHGSTPLDVGTPFKVCISDYITVRGDDGRKFTSWKVTAFVRSNAGIVRIETYRRYSDFVKLRNALLEKLLLNRNSETAAFPVELPELPPKVAWYESWRYNEVNFDRQRLAERQSGLERFLNGVLQDKEVMLRCRPEIVAFLQ